MKKIILSILILFFIHFVAAQNVGIGTTTPLARLHVTDSSVLFSAAGNIAGTAGLPPFQGPGRRMMWYPDKAAFRAGYVSNANWDYANTGNYSVALGNDNIAYGSASIAMGVNAGAIGNFSIAMGGSTAATGTSSTAIGAGTVASANYATAMGNNSIASGWYSTAMGANTVAQSGFETVLGRWNTDYTPSSTSGWVTGDRLFTVGNGTGSSSRSDALVVLKNGNTGIGTASPRFPLSFNTANGAKISLYDDGNPSQLHFGIGIFSNQLLQIHSATSGDDIAFGYGNSSNFIERMRIKGNGNVGIGTSTAMARLHVSDSNVLFTGPVTIPATTTYYPPASGTGTRMMWYPQKAAFRVGAVDGTQWNKDSIGRFSFATGLNTKSIGEASTSMGAGTTARGNYSTSMGSGTTASGDYSTSMGAATTASGIYSTSMGSLTKASGWFSTSMGDNTTASGNNSTSMGYQTNASGFYSTSMGYQTNASGNYSTSLGIRTNANGEGAISMGYETIASGFYSTAIGFSTKAKAFASFTTGIFNNDADNPNPDIDFPTDRIFQVGNGTFSSRSNAITVLRNGNTGIGTNTPTRPLSFPPILGEKILLYPGGTGEVGIGVYGNELRIHSDYAAAKISFGYQDNAGNFTQTMWLNNTTSVLTVGGTGYPSDERFKKQITVIKDPLQKLMTLNGVEYYMRKDEYPEMNFNHNRQTGLIAQEVEKVMPSAVYEINDKGYKGVDYAKLVPLLIEAIKELKQEVEALKNKN